MAGSSKDTDLAIGADHAQIAGFVESFGVECVGCCGGVCCYIPTITRLATPSPYSGRVPVGDKPLHQPRSPDAELAGLGGLDLQVRVMHAAVILHISIYLVYELSIDLDM